MKSIKIIAPGLFMILLACNNSEAPADAFGNFEAIEIMVSSEARGLIQAFAPREGDRLEQGAVAVVVDTIQLHLKRQQMQSVLASLGPRINTLDAQVRASKVQLEHLEREKQRIDKLVLGGAATSKQQDDVKGQIELLQAQIVATESQKASVYAERKTMEIQIRQVEDQIRKCTVRNPLDGVMLTKYKEAGEIAAPGQPLFKMANLDELILRAYISGDQLSAVKTGESVVVRFDAPE
ncbi:MAG: efflux RND transporter periplasmic adaptor subunit, partial [Bacteroidales bacterium]|nr:efflux RND transporter periplasmic adaptor subunit [Bacteroidales bacterium]